MRLTSVLLPSLVWLVTIAAAARVNLANRHENANGATSLLDGLLQANNSTTNDPRLDFHINGAEIPGVSNTTGDLGTLYGGMIPVDHKEPNRSMYFFYTPIVEDAQQGHDDLIIWMNGGPGCSSLGGAFTENGPFLLSTDPITKYTVAKTNPNTWRNFANVLYVEAPIHVGFGFPSEARIVDADGFGEEFVSWFKNWLEVFEEAKDMNIHLVGESYGSYYTLYTLDKFLDAGLNVRGWGTVDGVIADFVSWDLVFLRQFLNQHKQELNVSDEGVAQYNAWMELKGVDDAFIESVLQYPPQGGPIQLPEGFHFSVGEENAYDRYQDLVAVNNPCYIDYDIRINCDTPKPVLDGIAEGNTDPVNWVNLNTGFAQAINAPADVQWQHCSERVFVGGIWKDANLSPVPSESPFLGKVLDRFLNGRHGHDKRHGDDCQKKKPRVVMMNGRFDQLIKYNTTAVAIQNTTWSGLQGYQERPSTELIIAGVKKGIIHTERQVTLALVDECGHMCPKDDPTTANQLIKFLLGHIEENDLIGKAGGV